MEKENAIPEEGFTEGEQLKAWLITLPDHRAVIFSRIISMRAALRALSKISLLFTVKHNHHKWRLSLTVSTMRSLIVSRIGAATSTLGISGDLWEAARSATLSVSSRSSPAARSARSAAHSAYAAAFSAASLPRRSALFTGDSADSAAVSADPKFPTALWAAITADARALEAGLTPAEIAARALWPENSSIIPQFDRKTFLAAAPSFEVWLDWYEPIVEGKAPWGLPRDIATKLEERIALGDDRGEGGKDFWQRDADEVNAEIKSWVEAARAAMLLCEFNTSFQWAFKDGKFGIVGTGNADDEAAAKDPITAFQHSRARDRLKSFATRARAIEEIYGWQSFCPAYETLLQLVEKETEQIPLEIAQLYDASLAFASFAQFDADLIAMPAGNISALNAEDRRLYLEVVRTIAPWVRRFPTAKQLDDETGQFLFKAINPTPHIAIIQGASQISVISDLDRDLILQLLAAFQRSGFPAEKAAKRGVSGATGLALTVASWLGLAIGGGVVGKVVEDMKTAQPIIRFIAEQADNFLLIAANMPNDIKIALHLMIEEAKMLDGNNQPLLPENNAGKVRNRRR